MWLFLLLLLTQPMDPEKKKFERLIFPTQYVIPKSLKFSHWPSKFLEKKVPPTKKMSWLASRDSRLVHRMLKKISTSWPCCWFPIQGATPSDTNGAHWHPSRIAWPRHRPPPSTTRPTPTSALLNPLSLASRARTMSRKAPNFTDMLRYLKWRVSWTNLVSGDFRDGKLPVSISRETIQQKIGEDSSILGTWNAWW